MRNLLTDLRFGLRLLRLHPLFATTSIFVLALGIAANTVIFSVVNALLFRPLPYPFSERLVRITEGNDQLKSWGPSSFPNFETWKSQSQSLEGMSALVPDIVNVAGAHAPERVKCVRATSEFFSVLGLNVIQGRPFLSDDFSHGQPPMVILGHGYWQRRFGSRTESIGESMKIGGIPHAVAGVMSPEARLGFFLGFEPDLWLPLVPGPDSNRGARSLEVIARLKPEKTLEQAQAELASIATGLEELFPATNRGWKTMVDELRGTVDPIAYVLLSILVASILGITCSNVSSLLLSRFSARGKELAIRSAVGATKWDLVRQVLTESMLLAFVGGCLGTLLAFFSCGLIRKFSMGSNLEIVDVHPDAVVLCLTVLLFILSGIVVGLIPALRMSDLDLSGTLKEGRALSTGSSASRAGTLLTAAEVLLSFLLLAGGGVAIKSWFKLWEMEPGFRREGILTAGLSLPQEKYATSSSQLSFFQELLSRLESRPGLKNCGVASALPTLGPRVPFAIEGRPAPTPGAGPLARYTAASAGYLRALAIPTRAGRSFDDGDNVASLAVVLINETLAHRFWDRGSPLGEVIEIKGKRRTIVGVIGDLRNAPLAVKPFPEVYVPFSQSPEGYGVLSVTAPGGDQSKVDETVREVVHALDPEQPVDSLMPLQEVLRKNMGVITLGSRMLLIMGLVALGLASIGIYGVVSYSVARRSVEFGIRMALGAKCSQVLWMVLRQTAGVTLTGLVPGLPLALILVRALSTALYGVRAVEPWILAVIALVLASVGLLAGYVPARRATRVEPLVALRSQ